MIKYEDIEQANKTIKATPIKGKDYAEVNQRVKAFRMCFPNGSITTEILKCENGVVVMKATAQDEDGKVLGTGLAYEKEDSSFINKQSYIENCETSAVGRALGMCGFGIDVSVASSEEIENANANEWKNKFFALCAEKQLDVKAVAKDYKLNGKVTEERFKEVCEDLCKMS